MAGPVAVILTEQILSEDQIQDIKNWIKEHSSFLKGEDFWIKDRPFLISFGPDYEGSLEDYRDRGAADIIGWNPQDEIGICAMANQDLDHTILAEMCIAISQKVDGLIDFTGKLPLTNKNVEGTLYALPETPVDEGLPNSHIGDAEFLKFWMKEKNFRMIK